MTPVSQDKTGSSVPPTVSAALWTFAASGILTCLGNLIGIAERPSFLIPKVESLEGLLATSLLIAAVGFLPYAFGESRKRSFTLWGFLTSIRLTIFLLATSTLMILLGTLDQVHDGIYLTQKRYFEHVFAVWKYPPQWILHDVLHWIRLPIPAGYFVGPLLVLNLFCAHFRYYRAGLRKLGIAMIHGGLVLLLIGQLITQIAQKEYFMWLAEGESSGYVESFHEDELVVVDKSDPDFDRVISWPVSAFKHSQTALRHPSIPFVINVAGYTPNAAIMPKAQAPTGASDFEVNRGIGQERGFAVMEMPPTYADGERNRATAIVDINTAEGPLGRWLLSTVFRDKQPTAVPVGPQSFQYQGKNYEIALRFRREYLPAQIQLLDFSHDRYSGTEIPFNFSSKVRIVGESEGSKRENLIYMNHPMRFAGLTFYQASFANNDTMSMFQVVRNPGRALPYISCVLISVGMLWQFGFSLVLFAIRRSGSSSDQSAASKEIV